MKKQKQIRRAAALLALSVLLPAGQTETLSAFAAGAAETAQGAETGGKEPVRAVTYAGNEWVINFWNSEMNRLPEDFRQIRADDFNTVIVCVPWREFQPYTARIGYNEEALGRLRLVMEEASRQGLSVMLRLGYCWDFYDDSDILLRYRSLLYDNTYQYAWKEYAKKIYETVSPYDSFGGAFLTWEDFWNFTETAKQLSGTAQGKKFAQESGFTAYVLEHCGEEERRALYGDSARAAEPEFPEAGSPAWRLFMDWYDSWLSDLLSETQEVFPGLSMECRLDKDPYTLPDGEKAWYDHSKTYGCGASAYTSVMLSAGMGFSEGDLLTADQVLEMSGKLLRETGETAQKPVFVDQFLYMETTPGFENNAKLLDTEINSYLSGMGEVLRRESIGYGIWTYRDYADNVIYNPEFGLSLKGWKASGQVSAEQYGGSTMAKLAKGAMLSQELQYRNYLSDQGVKLQLRAVAKEPVTLTVRVGGVQRTADVNGDETVTLTFPAKTAGSISFYASGELLLDDVKLYSHITEGGIYEMDGTAGPYLSGIRSCNQRLSGQE